MADPGRKARLVQEAKSASALNRSNIIHVYGVTADNDVDFNRHGVRRRQDAG